MVSRHSISPVIVPESVPSAIVVCWIVRRDFQLSRYSNRGNPMKKPTQFILQFLSWILKGAVVGAAVALLHREFDFGVPQALILIAVLAAWWTTNKKIDQVKQQTNWLYTATNGLVLPRLMRVERRQRGWKVPEPPKEGDEDGEYDDWSMFCEPAEPNEK